MSNRKIVVFCIGGAADKYTYFPIMRITHLVRDSVQKPLDERIIYSNYTSVYLEFREVYKKKMETHVYPHIPDKENTTIHIIGHSLGGWNGAHLAEILGKEGYHIGTLVTLDPVGKCLTVKLTHLYWNTPEPICDFWINILASPQEIQQDDIVALSGIKWKPELAQVGIFHTPNLHHRDVEKMFTTKTDAGISALDYLVDAINGVE